MSAGLMSCVRENSPPLEMGDGTAIQQTDFDGSSPPPLPPGTPGKYECLNLIF